jgi:hypothetical protein
MANNSVLTNFAPEVYKKLDDSSNSFTTRAGRIGQNLGGGKIMDWLAAKKLSKQFAQSAHGTGATPGGNMAMRSGKFVLDNSPQKSRSDRVLSEMLDVGMGFDNARGATVEDTQRNMYQQLRNNPEMRKQLTEFRKSYFSPA